MHAQFNRAHVPLHRGSVAVTRQPAATPSAITAGWIECPAAAASRFRPDRTAAGCCAATPRSNRTRVGQQVETPGLRTFCFQCCCSTRSCAARLTLERYFQPRSASALPVGVCGIGAGLPRCRACRAWRAHPAREHAASAAGRVPLQLLHRAGAVGRAWPARRACC